MFLLGKLEHGVYQRSPNDFEDEGSTSSNQSNSSEDEPDYNEEEEWAGISLGEDGEAHNIDDEQARAVVSICIVSLFLHIDYLRRSLMIVT